MYNRLLITTFLCVLAQSAFGQYTLSGTILEEKSKYPVEYAAVVINDNELWAISNDKGVFQIKNVPKGPIRIAVTCMGFAKKTFELNITANLTDLTWYLSEENLSLEGVTVTAQNKTNEMAGSYVVDRVSLEHLQMLSVPDVMSLLPGGQTNTILHLADTRDPSMILRGELTERGNAAFGTAVEVDGVRLSNNSSIGINVAGATDFTRLTQRGTDTRNVASSNVESVEVITGIPSVAYGDVTQGVVKINTRKGKSPYSVEITTNPNTKSFSLNKGFGLGGNAGILNVNIERAKSISDPMSPYTSYDRNNLSLLYDNTFNRGRRPLSLTVGVTGNIGGYNNLADPDRFTDTYTKAKDNSLRLHTRIDYLPNLTWITNLEITAGVTYSDKMTERRLNQSSSSTTTSRHGIEEGYFVAQNYDQYPDAPIVQIPSGYWYQVAFVDNKPLNMNASIKARLSKKWGILRNNVLLGSDLSSSGNRGKGLYFEDMRYAPTWREYPFNELPYMNNLAVFLEDKMDWSLGACSLQLMGGVRSDMTFIKGSEYGTVGSLSPRVNTIFAFPKDRNTLLKMKSIRFGYGKSVKLPSLNVLYPNPKYSDTPIFATSVSGNENFEAFHIMPLLPQYSPDLRWQYNLKTEAGLDLTVKKTTVSITVYQDQIFNSYESINVFEPFHYKYTDIRSLENCFIPFENREFFVDQTTGIVRVSDKTGQIASMELDYINRSTFKQVEKPINGSPILKRGLDWTVDFGRIPALSTSIRWDGKVYYYKSIDETIFPYKYGTTMADGNPTKYLAYVVGSSTLSNGNVKTQVNSNLTFVTHIPSIRFIVSLRVEASLYNYSRYLSEYQGQPYGFVVDNETDYFPSETRNDIYAGNQQVRKYPLYYVSLDDMNTKIPFAQALKDARENNPALYVELIKMIPKTNYSYTLNPNRVSMYATAHINLTKEIGNFASISFNAKNFINTMQLFTSSWNGSKTTLFGYGGIPLFYYGLSLKLKL